MKSVGNKASSGHPLRDAAWLVFLLLLAMSVQIGGPDDKLDLDLGTAHAAETSPIELNLPAVTETEESACPSASPSVLSLPTTPESPRPGCSDQGQKDRLSC